MTFEQVKMFLYGFGGELGKLVQAGDPLAKKVYDAYRSHHASPLDVKRQNELIASVKDFAERSVTVSELTDLERRYGTDHPDKPVFREPPH